MQLLAILSLLSGCSLFKPQNRTSPAGELPQTYSVESSESDPARRWWEEFEDPELNRLVDQAFTGNLSLKEAWARLNQANALAVQAGAARYPDLAVSGGTDWYRQRTKNETTETNSIGEYSLGLISSFELDLWGRIRSGQEAAFLEAAASREDVNAAAITLVSEVAVRWANIISQKMQRQLLEQQLETNRTYLWLVELRFRKSMVSALDVYQQKQILEAVKAQLPLVEAQEQLLRHELALLMGKLPATPLKINRNTLPVPQKVPAAGLPAELLSNRPDIRAAFSRLQAADRKISVAQADRLPAISLTAETSFGPAGIDLIFDNWFLGLASNLAAPILDGNRRAAEVDRTRAVADENLALYRESVLTAVKDVEDALVSEARQRDHLEALELQIDAARNALDQAKERYLKGLNDYLPVLTQLLAVQKLERDLIQQRTLLLVDRISLYRSLGGTWPDTLALAAGK